MNQLAIPGRKRIESIDLLRGVVMIIMALDHVRDYFHADYFYYDPADINKTNLAVFLTRWITHFCAPAFVFLAGTSASLMGERKSKPELSRFLFTRGIWLVLLEITVVDFAWYFNPHFPIFRLQTIWSLGISMMALSALIYLPKKGILIIGLLIVFCHNTLDSVHVDGNGPGAFAWALIHVRKFFDFHGHTIRVSYPVLSWIGIMMLGYSFGSLYKKEMDAKKRKKELLLIGFSAITLFILLRLSNLYGDMSPWTSYDSTAKTVISFLNVTKYPPSLLYTLMTLGPCILFLAFTEKPLGKLGTAISRVGRVPMFFYILHLYLIHAGAMLAAELTTKSWRDMIMSSNVNPQLKGYGFSLWGVYAVWIVLILILYPLCKWYDKYKSSHREKWWLSYL